MALNLLLNYDPSKRIEAQAGEGHAPIPPPLAAVESMAGLGRPVAGVWIISYLNHPVLRLCFIGAISTRESHSNSEP